MKRILKILGALCILAMAVGGVFVSPICHPTQRSEIKRLDNVSRVMMHEPHRYTILVEETTGQVTQHNFGSWCGHNNVPKIFHDVPTAQPMWVEYRTATDFSENTCNELIAIHIHSVTEINGAGWSHGKLGQGQTTIVE